MDSRYTSVLYVIYNPLTKMVKIGVTSDLRQRLHSLRYCSGCPLELSYYTKPLMDAYKLEDALHEHFKNYRGIGEWFSVDLSKAIKSVKEVEVGYDVSKLYVIYMEKKSVSYCANKLEYSRAYISKRLKALGVTQDAYSEEAKVVNIGYSEKEKLEDRSEEKLDTSGKFERVSANISSNGKCFKVSKYMDGSMSHKLFSCFEDAEEYLEKLNK